MCLGAFAQFFLELNGIELLIVFKPLITNQCFGSDDSV